MVPGVAGGAGSGVVQSGVVPAGHVPHVHGQEFFKLLQYLELLAAVHRLAKTVKKIIDAVKD